MAGISLASAGTPVASIGANSSAMGQLPGLHGAPFNAVGNGGATATGNSNTGSVSTHANAVESAFGGPASGNPNLTTAGARGTAGAVTAITP